MRKKENPIRKTTTGRVLIIEKQNLELE